jgi:hypothetical protein
MRREQKESSLPDRRIHKKKRDLTRVKRKGGLRGRKREGGGREEEERESESERVEVREEEREEKNCGWAPAVRRTGKSWGGEEKRGPGRGD